jgi:hypothetical protein
MNPQEILYCENCAKTLLHNWRGWPHKQNVPVLPRIQEGVCESCGQANTPISSSKIGWLNYHSEFSTGLPDYWLLEVKASRPKWGKPYFAEGICPRCAVRTVISQMLYPNGTGELMHNCPKCGVLPARPDEI